MTPYASFTETDGDNMTFVPLLEGMESNKAFLRKYLKRVKQKHSIWLPLQDEVVPNKECSLLKQRFSWKVCDRTTKSPKTRKGD